MSLFSKLGIHSKKDLLHVVKQFIKFGIVGISNTLISLAIYYIFVFINRDYYIIGNTVGFVVGVLNSYFWNNKFVFQKTQKGNARPLFKTFLSYGSTFLLGTALLFVMVHYLGISEMLAPLINLLVTIPLNFILNKYWAFK